MSCCGDNCGCGSACKCGDGCGGCKMYPEVAEVAPSKGSKMNPEMAEEVTDTTQAAIIKDHTDDGFEAGVAAGNGCKCNPCRCDPCNC